MCASQEMLVGKEGEGSFLCEDVVHALLSEVRLAQQSQVKLKPEILSRLKEFATKDNRLKMPLVQVYDAGLGEFDAGTYRTYQASLKWLEAQIPTESHVVMCHLGMRYQYGRGVERNAKKALEYFQAAVERNHDEAIKFLEVIKAEQRGDLNLPCHLLTVFSDKEKLRLEVNMAHRKNEKIRRKTLKSIEKLAAIDDDFKILLSKIYYYGHGEYEAESQETYNKSIVWMRKAAANQHPEAMKGLGVHYWHGKGVPVDETMALQYFEEAIQLGDSESFQFSTLLKVNQFLLRNEKLDARVLEDLKSLSCVDNQFVRNLILVYRNGLGECDEGSDDAHREEVRWLRKAAENNDPEAIRDLGVCYEDAIGVPRDLAVAHKLYTQAAELGDAVAFLKLGVTEKDEKKAAYYFKCAKKLGNKDADVHLLLLKVRKEKRCHSKMQSKTLSQLKERAQHDDHIKIVLAEIYRSGYGEYDAESPEGRREEIMLLEAAAQNGCNEAYFRLGVIYSSSQMTERNKEKSLYYLRLAKDKKITAAEWSLGDDIFESLEEDFSPRNEMDIFKVSSVQQIRDLLPSQLTMKCWFISDIDYALITPKDPLGRSKGQLICQAILRSDPRWRDEESRRQLIEHMMCKLEYELMDPEIPDLIQHIKDLGIPTLAMTRINLEMKEIDALTWRIDHLASFGLHFDAHVESDERVDWSGWGGYWKGVIRAGKNQKGEALGYFMDNIKKEQPSKIIFIDNSRRYLESVKRLCKKRGIQFCGLHFVGHNLESDPDPDPSVIDKQIEMLASTGNILLYAEAARLVNEEDSPEALAGTSEEDNLFKKWENIINYGSEDSTKYIMESAERKHYLAEACLASLYYEGWGGIEQNRERALHYARECSRKLHEEADKDNKYALYFVGHMYKIGVGIKQDEKKAFDFFVKSAHKGNARAMSVVGLCYLRGQGAPADKSKALTYFLLSSQFGYAEAARPAILFEANEALQAGEKLESDFLDLLQEYAKTDNAFKIILAQIYHSGLGEYEPESESTYREEIRLLKEAEENGSRDAVVSLGLSYWNGHQGTEKNEEKAEEYFLRAEQMGDKDGTKYLMLLKMRACLTKNQKIPKLILLRSKEIALCDNDVKFVLAEVYRCGLGEYGEESDATHREAVKWLKEAEGDGATNSLVPLGVSYWLGQGVSQDQDIAMSYFSRANQLGVEEGKKYLTFIQLIHCLQKGEKLSEEMILSLKELAAKDDATKVILAYVYNNGLGELKVGSAETYQEALRWLELLQNPEVLFSLGLLYFGRPDDSGILGDALYLVDRKVYHVIMKSFSSIPESVHKLCEIRCSESKTVRCWERASYQGHSLAQTHLGFMYAAGRGCETQDLDKAIDLWQKVYDSGDKSTGIYLAWVYMVGTEKLGKDPSRAFELLLSNLDDEDEDLRLTTRYMLTLVNGRDSNPLDISPEDVVQEMYDAGYIQAQYELNPTEFRDALRENLARFQQNISQKDNHVDMTNLGWLYEKGLGVKEQSRDEALKFYRLAGINGGFIADLNCLRLIIPNVY